MRALAILIACLCGFQTHAEIDTSLMRQIKSWHKGDAPPGRLLKFPDGKIDMMPGCGLRVLGSEVRNYVGQIKDADLLAALLFDPRVHVDSFHAAVSQLIELKGVDYVARLVSERHSTKLELFASSELAVLSQLLCAPYIKVQVIRISSKDMTADKAESALLAMRTDLEHGASWSKAYRKHSRLHPDRSKPKYDRTLLCYLYDSTISATGFDIITYGNAVNLPCEHLAELFRLKRGTQVLTAADGVYLYHIQSYYDGKP